MDETITHLRKKSIDKMQLESLDILIIFLNALSEELISVIKACLIKEVPRIDIILEYFHYFHEHICTYMTKF